MEKNPFVIDSEQNHYIKLDYQTGNWVSNGENLDVNFMMVDFSTIKMGWIWYENATKTYHEVWQPDLYTQIPKPGENYKRGFSVLVLPIYIEGDKNIKHPPMLWKRNSYAEYSGFMEMGKCFFDQIQNNDNLLPVVSVLESQEIVYSSGFKAYKPQFQMAKWQPRPDNFVVPLEIDIKEHGAEDDSPEVNTPLSSAPQKPDLKEFTLDDDDIPF